MAWRVDIYDKQGRLICYHYMPSHTKAERVANDVTRNAPVVAKAIEVEAS